MLPSTARFLFIEFNAARFLHEKIGGKEIYPRN